MTTNLRNAFHKRTMFKYLAIGVATCVTGLSAFSVSASEKKAAGHGTEVAKASIHGPAKGHSGAPQWGYAGAAGPEHWGDLSPAFRVCGIGLQQSPINLHRAIEATAGEIVVDYKPTPIEVVNNGHTIQVNVAPGSNIRLDGKTYKLLQFHFHHPSEHLIDGKSFDMEAHFVHISDDGVLAVLGVMIRPGAGNAVLAPIWDIMPTSKGKRHSSSIISPADLLPADRTFFRYYGSLTTPPCSEKVIWSVFAEPLEASSAQAQKFSSAFSMNARPIQPLHRRYLLGSR